MLPTPGTALLDVRDGGHLVVNPPRDVWERSQLRSEELCAWSKLVASAGEAMLACLPQLEGGCINYWEAGNWALNDAAPPAGRKVAQQFRSVHLHLLGRSPRSMDPDWRWGEAPRFPEFVNRKPWSAKFERLGREECEKIVERVAATLKDKYGLAQSDLRSGTSCASCGYPIPGEQSSLCEECRDSA